MCDIIKNKKLKRKQPHILKLQKKKKKIETELKNLFIYPDKKSRDQYYCSNKMINSLGDN